MIGARGIGCLLIALGCAGGCLTDPPPQAKTTARWRFIPEKSGGREAGSDEPRRRIPEIVVGLEGESGFARATLSVERKIANARPRSSLYDILFPVESRVRLIAAVEETTGVKTVAKIKVRAESGTSVSESFIEPGVPFFDPEARVTLVGVSDPGRGIAEGHEVGIAQWVVVVGQETTTVTFRVLLSKTPTPPRLKPEGKPPV